MKEIDEMVAELKKIKKALLFFMKQLAKIPPVKFKVFNNIFDAYSFAKENKFLKGFYAENNCWAIYENLEELRQRCIVEGMFQDELKMQEFLGFRKNR